MTVAAEIEALRGEFTTALARVEGKLDGYIALHTAVHAAVEANSRDDRIPERVRQLEDWQLEDRAARAAQTRLIKAVFGTSVLTGVMTAAMIGYYLVNIAHLLRLP